MAPDFDTTLVSQYIRSIFQDSKGRLWFGTIGEGVVRYDEKTLTYFSNPDGFRTNSVFAINEDKNGNMWFGTDQGVYKYDPRRAVGKAFRNYNQKDGLNHIDISRKSILVDRSGKIWVGTHGGVYQYDPSADSAGSPCFSLFPLLPSIHVAGILEDKAGTIWFASSNKGVFRYDGKTIVNYNQKEELGENYAGGLAQDKAGNMWFTMKNGICKFDLRRPVGETFTEYTAKDGLGGTEFWGISIEQSGIVWIIAGAARQDLTLLSPYPILKHSLFSHRLMVRVAVCKVCFRINQAIRDGVQDKGFISLTALNSIKSNKMGHGSVSSLRTTANRVPHLPHTFLTTSKFYLLLSLFKKQAPMYQLGEVL